MVDRRDDDSNLTNEKEFSISDKQSPTFEDFELLIEDRTFVDYLNVFLSLPVFGQRAIYDVFEEDFEFNPLVRRRREFIHRKGVFQWLYNERYPLFCSTSLYMEYLLCCSLRDLCLLFQPNCPDKALDLDNPIATRNFTSNLIGHVMGMQIFRESLKGTSGEKVFQSWMDIEKLKFLESQPERREEIQRFKDTYLRSGSKKELLQRYKNVAYHGFFNFDIIPEADEHILQESELRAVHVDAMSDVDSLDTLVSLQTVLLRALKRYWLPRFVIHVLSTESLDVIRDLFEADSLMGIDFNQIKNILKCRKLFPRVSSSHVFSTDTLLISPVAEDFSFSYLSETPETFTSSNESPKPRVTDLLTLCGGMRFNISSGSLMSPDEVTSLSPISGNKLSSDKSDSPEPEILKSSVTDLLEITSDSKLTEESVRKTLLSGIKRPEQETMPLILKNFIYGLRVVDPVDIRISDRILYGIASDHLAGFPFRKFLRSNQMHLELWYLSFWNDIHNYTQIEEDSVFDVKQNLAKKIINKYLRSKSPNKEIFNDSLKVALIDCLSTGNDESLLYFSHDIVSGSLHLSWRKFIKSERKNFATLSCGKRHDQFMRSFNSSSEESSSTFSPTSMSTGSTSGLTSEMSDVGSSFFRDQSKSPYELLFGANADLDEKCFLEKKPSLPSESVDILANETTCFRSFEFAIMLCYPKVDGSGFSTIADICRNLKKPRGSLHVEIQEPVRQKWLAEMVNPTKINIAELDVSRHVEDEEYGFRAFAPEDWSEGIESKPPNRMVIRRNGVMLFRPCKPRSFMEVLMNQTHAEYFRRYMMSNDAMTPLQFWNAVEDMKNTQSPQGCQIKAYKVFKRFFGKQAKGGEGLDSKDEIIKLLSTVTKASPGMLICAQTCIYRMMERKWYPGYLETFPTDADLKDVHMSVSNLMLDVSDSSTSTSSWAPKKKKVYKKKTYHLWHGFLRLIQEFLTALKNRSEMRIFEIYLRSLPEETSTAEAGNEQASNAKKSKEATQSPSAMANNNDSRVILRSKVVSVSKLPRDLQFWLEVTKFREQFSGLDYSKPGTRDDGDLRMEKAKAIVNCFLQSEVSPRVQVNVPSDIAIAASNNLHMHGAQRGLFHEASVVLFPILYHYWRRFKEEWLSHESPDKCLKKHERKFKSKVVCTPHRNIAVPDYTKVHVKDLSTYTYQSFEEGWSRINFTIMHGIRILLPRIKGCRSEEFDELDVDPTPSKLRSPGYRNTNLSRLNISQTGRRKSGREFSSLSLAAKEGTVGDQKGTLNKPSAIQEVHSPGTLEKLQNEKNNRRMSVYVEKVKDSQKIDAKDMALAVEVAMKKPVMAEQNK